VLHDPEPALGVDRQTSRGEERVGVPLAGAGGAEAPFPQGDGGRRSRHRAAARLADGPPELAVGAEDRNVMPLAGVADIHGPVRPRDVRGLELDAESSLYYNRLRYYDPAAGRFISEDPIGFAGGDGNLYRYVGNSPLDFTDPMGLSVISTLSNAFSHVSGFVEGALSDTVEGLHQFFVDGIGQFLVTGTEDVAVGAIGAAGVWASSDNGGVLAWNKWVNENTSGFAARMIESSEKAGSDWWRDVKWTYKGQGLKAAGLLAALPVMKRIPFFGPMATNIIDAYEHGWRVCNSRRLGCDLMSLVLMGLAGRAWAEADLAASGGARAAAAEAGVQAPVSGRAGITYPSGQPQVVRAGEAVRSYLGEDFIIKRADAEGFVAISKDGTRRFRMDYTGHGHPPHGHIEVLDPKGRWVDAGPQHQYPFKDTGH